MLFWLALMPHSFARRWSSLRAGFAAAATARIAAMVASSSVIFVSQLFRRTQGRAARRALVDGRVAQPVTSEQRSAGAASSLRGARAAQKTSEQKLTIEANSRRPSAPPVVGSRMSHESYKRVAARSHETTAERTGIAGAF